MAPQGEGLDRFDGGANDDPEAKVRENPPVQDRTTLRFHGNLQSIRLY
jgi:hypothetical protein